MVRPKLSMSLFSDFLGDKGFGPPETSNTCIGGLFLCEFLFSLLKVYQF